ncbi:MAG: reverse transcriptase family protein, partial [Bacteroidota bacterium]
NPEYRHFEIPKRSGGIRKVTVPSENLMKVQRKINIMLQAIYSTKFPEPVHGFVSVSKDDKILATTGRGIVTNAAPHVGKDFVLNLDLKDFFSSISATTVRKIFTGFPFYFDWELATCIALVCTYEKKLPTGSPTSPVLSNFACREMDKLLLQLSTENKIIFTRYADDITFSSNVAFNDELIKNILIQIKKSGFTVNEKKFRIQNKFNKQVVTG